MAETPKIIDLPMSDAELLASAATVLRAEGSALHKQINDFRGFSHGTSFATALPRSPLYHKSRPVSILGEPDLQTSAIKR